MKRNSKSMEKFVRCEGFDIIFKNNKFYLYIQDGVEYQIPHETIKRLHEFLSFWLHKMNSKKKDNKSWRSEYFVRG